MFNKKLFKNNKNRFIFFIVSLFFLLISCKTTRTLDHISLNNGDFYVVADDLEFEELDTDNPKYIFFRLYNPEYNNPLYIANILKNGLKATQIPETPNVSHASINFTLDDNFYGLSLGGKYQLSPESCVNPKSNKYMKNCDPKRSEQITYALRVTEQEYEDTKRFVEFYAKNTKLKYKSSINFGMALFSIKRKFFTPEENQQFGNVIYKKAATNKHVSYETLENDENIETDFVCSTFVGYVLYSNVDEVSDFFDAKDIKYEYLNVSDIAEIPGVVPLFYSTWADYDKAALSFTEKFPEFKQYFNN